MMKLTIPVFAHPGSLDENGGHYDRSTGEYHYHHGYPAHQHNNGECPYDFHDNANTEYNPNTNSSSSSSSYKPSEPTTINQNKSSANVSIFTVIKNWFSRNSTNIFCFWMYFICIPLCVIFCFIMFIKKEPPTWLYITEGVAWAIALLLIFLSN